MTKTMTMVMVLLVAFAFTVPAQADVFDKVNGFLDNVNNKLDEFNNGLNTQTVRTPGIVPDNVGGAPVAASKIDFDFGTDGRSDPSTGLSKKALEAMALFGNQWAKLKLEELRVKEIMDRDQATYKGTSWWNLFSKVGNYFDLRRSRKEYEAAREKTMAYERDHPGCDKIVQGIDSVNETVLEFKALFGNKKAKAQLELLRTQREYEKLKYEYDKAGMLEKLKLKSDLGYAQRRYERALENYAALNGGNNRANAAVSNTGGITASSPAAGGNQISAFAKQQMDAAYKRYMKYMGKRNPDPATLQQLKMEYEMTLQEYNRVNR